MQTLTVKDLIERWNVSEHTIYRWLDTGELRGFNVARNGRKRPTWRFRLTDVEAFEEARSNQPKPDSRKPRRKSRKEPVASTYERIYPE